MNQRTGHYRSIQLVFSWIALLAGVAVFALLYFATDLDLFLLWIATWSTVTLVLYGYDKTQAKRGGIRVPEIVLHGLALAGGFPGGWLGMFLFNHKKRKRTFWAVLTAATILWIGIYLIAVR